MKDTFTIICLVIMGLCLLVTIGSSIYGIIKSIVLKRKAKKELKEKHEGK